MLKSNKNTVHQKFFTIIYYENEKLLYLEYNYHSNSFKIYFYLIKLRLIKLNSHETNIF